MNNMGDLFCTVFLSDIVQHSSASIVVKVSINIRQRDAVGIQKTLEQQVIFHRVNLGDSQAICHS